MGFLRRLLGGSGEGRSASDADPAGAADAAPVNPERSPTKPPDDLPNDEVERERALLRADAQRLDDELIQRQMRYADRSWTPPRQGGDRRADDEADKSG